VRVQVCFGELYVVSVCVCVCMLLCCECMLGATGEIVFGQAGQRQGDAGDGRELPVDEATTTAGVC
jgi:hypothetical protein